MTNPQDRRTFLRLAAAAAGALTTAPVLGRESNDKVVVGLIGCGNRGAHPQVGLAPVIARSKNAQLAWVCDPVKSRRDSAAGNFGIDSRRAVSDLRRILDDKSVNAVFIATPDHWHCPAAILACEAGKHVYLEKPMSHNVREGRLLVEAADRNKVLLQVGMQARSTGMFIEAVKLLRDGAIGDVLSAKCWNIQRRPSIGRAQPEAPPAELDYETWIGPTPMVPYQANRVLENKWWSRWHSFGTGDMGNDGIHELDQARWGLGAETHPTRIVAMGTNSFFDDDGEFPDTQQVVFEYPGGSAGHGRTLVYEQRMWSTNYPYNVDSGVEFYGTEGQLFVSRRGKLQLRGKDNKVVEVSIRPEPSNAAAHAFGFLDAVATDDRSKLTTHALMGHLSTSLTHLGNIAARVGRALTFDPTKEQIVGDEEANGLLRRTYRDHWATPANV